MNKFISLCFFLIVLTAGYAAPQATPDAETLRNLALYPIPGDQLFPDISFVDQDDRSLKLSDFNESVILLNFWATWCPSCRVEMPSMEKLAKELENYDFAMIPINVQESPKIVEAFLEEFSIDFPVYYDFDGSTANEVGVIGLPLSILIDRNGVALAAVAGAFEWYDDNLVAMMKKWAGNTTENDGGS